MEDKKKFSLMRLSGPVSSVVSIVGGLLVGLLILFITNPQNALSGFGWIIGGGVQSLKDFGNVFYYATPIIMTGLSVAFAFKCNLFNIGATGQFTMGAVGAVLVGVKLTQLGSIHWIVALLAAMLFGAVWGAIPGVLKALFNVNEVITCIMTNYIGMYLVNMIVRDNVYHRLTNRSLPVANTALVPKAGLDSVFPTSMVNAGIFIAILAGIIIYIVISKTTFGYELRAVGYNRDASLYAGINVKKNMILTMVIAGALAGLGGGLLFLAGTGNYLAVEDVLRQEGFTGISVALLGRSHPIGAIFAGLFIAYIQVGGSYMQLSGFFPEIVEIITATIIYFAAFANGISALLQKLQNKKKREEK